MIANAMSAWNLCAGLCICAALIAIFIQQSECIRVQEGDTT